MLRGVGIGGQELGRWGHVELAMPRGSQSGDVTQAGAYESGHCVSESVCKTVLGMLLLRSLVMASVAEASVTSPWLSPDT